MKNRTLNYKIVSEIVISPSVYDNRKCLSSSRVTQENHTRMCMLIWLRVICYAVWYFIRNFIVYACVHSHRVVVFVGALASPKKFPLSLSLPYSAICRQMNVVRVVKFVVLKIPEKNISFTFQSKI